ncbi:MAG: bifunctional phosphoribosyl-AMP cyclohydrolase/phosphoribosyl-ATP diphosphatase HisIE [Bacillota bacterium]|nr:bifunctional phosphoribosyl-AMP cyclohydrolase/phosphoribosyl-ATP diphosphatase HisIE [Bacillota bacterium]
MTNQINYDASGLIPAIIQNSVTGDVLMLGYMNEEALEITKSTGWVTFYSRKRQKLWQKGETSGNRLKASQIKLDCDQDTLLILAIPQGPTCHTGNTSCFFSDPIKSLDSFPSLYNTLFALEETVEQRKQSGSNASYTKYLFDSGIDKILKKVGEEASEVIIASKNDDIDPIIDEVSDLLYHLTVLLREKNISVASILGRLRSREK